MAGFWNEVPVSRLPILLACTNWVVYTSEGGLKWEAICGWCSVFISFSPSFFMCQFNVISSGKPAQHLPTPTPSRWGSPLLLAGPASFSQQLLQLQLNVYLGDCLLNACLFHLTICSMGAGGPCIVYSPLPRACHGVWHIVGANLLPELIKK